MTVGLRIGAGGFGPRRHGRRWRWRGQRNRQKTAPVTLGQANTATVELLYSTGGKITGSVRFSDGSPIAGADFSLPRK